MEMIHEAAYWAGIGFCMASGGIVGLSIMIHIIDWLTFMTRKLKKNG